MKPKTLPLIDADNTDPKLENQNLETRRKGGNGGIGASGHRTSGHLAMEPGRAMTAITAILIK